jgi:hypothetical protein
LPLLLFLWLLSASCETPIPTVWGSSTSTFSLARELAQGTSSIIVVPGNHTVAGEFEEKGEPLQLTRWAAGVTGWPGSALSCSSRSS